MSTSRKKKGEVEITQGSGTLKDNTTVLQVPNVLDPNPAQIPDLQPRTEEPSPAEIPEAAEPSTEAAVINGGLPGVDVKNGVLTSKTSPAIQTTAVKKPTEIDPLGLAQADAFHEQQKSFADMMQDIRNDYQTRISDLDAEEKEQRSNAAWAGATQLAAALANMIGVGSFGAANQTIPTNFSQDWMRKADETRRRKELTKDRLSETRRQLETQLLNLRTQYRIAVAKNDIARAERQVRNEYYRAQAEHQRLMTAYYAAKTQAEKEATQQKAAEAKKKLDLLDAQIKSFEALAGQRDAAAYSSRTRADAQKDSVQNQNENRDKKTGQAVATDKAREDYWKERPRSGGGQSKSAQTSSGAKKQEDQYSEFE